MSARLLVTFMALAAATAKPIGTAQNNFVPGVFISSETLKDLQAKAQQNQNPAITNQGIQPINIGRNVPGISPSSQNDESIGSTYPTNSQNNPQNQPTVLANPPLLGNSQNVPNQPTVMVQNPPQIIPQPVFNQPSNQPILLSQPNQPIMISQPGYNQQPPVYLSQSPNNQFTNQPNQQFVLSNGQIAQLVSTNGQPFVNNGQPLINNGQPILSNGQPIYISSNPGNQPLLVSTSSPGNQITLVQGSRPNTVQNPNTGVQYAVVPVGQNTVVSPNTNLSNGSTYVMVPSTNQVYAVSG